MTTAHKRPSAKIWRKVIKATWGFRGVKLSDRHATAGRYWFLQLECGHEVVRSFRYNRATGKRGFRFEDAKPAPKRVLCKECRN